MTFQFSYVFPRNALSSLENKTKQKKPQINKQAFYAYALTLRP